MLVAARKIEAIFVYYNSIFVVAKTKAILFISIMKYTETVFTYLDAFSTNDDFAEFWPEYQNLDELKDHYRRGGLGDMKKVAIDDAS